MWFKWDKLGQTDRWSVYCFLFLVSHRQENTVVRYVGGEVCRGVFAPGDLS